MERYPDYETYRALYLRYFDGRDVGEILDLLEPLAKTRVLDLCGGEGRLALEALARGAESAILVDREERMIPEKLYGQPHLNVSVGNVHEKLADFRRQGQSFERIACRQAVNYWLNEETAELLGCMLSRGGIFAFNTFNRRPPEKPRVTSYELDGHTFMEVSWLVGSTVHHLQVRNGMAPHHTSFAWLSPKFLRDLLGPHFVITEKRRGKTSLYQCKKM